MSKNSLHPEVILMNRNDVRNAVKQGKHSKMETAVMVIVPAVFPDKCSLQNVPNVARILKYRFNPVMTDRYIAVIATAK
jgi:peroxiredoxin